MADLAAGPGPRPRLLVVRLSALGDVIHTLPAVALLRRHFDIDWVVESAYRELVERVGQVRAIPVSLKRWSLSRIRAAWSETRGHGTAVDFQGLIKSALVVRFSGARVRYGFTSELVREKPAAWLTNRHVAIDPRQHVVHWNLALARAAVPADRGDRATERDPFASLAFSPFLDLRVAEPGAVVLLPGAGRPEKLWPVERFRAVAADAGKRALAVWGPGEEERARAIGCRVAPPTTLRELAGVLSRAALVIGGDTGPLHLAAAIGTPVIGLYAPTDPRRNGPYGQLDHCVSTYSSSRTMDAIGAEEVTGRMRALLK